MRSIEYAPSPVLKPVAVRGIQLLEVQWGGVTQIAGIDESLVSALLAMTMTTSNRLGNSPFTSAHTAHKSRLKKPNYV